MTGDSTQVAIVGGGPAGLLLSHLLSLRDIDSVVIESRDPEYAYQRVRAGVLDWAVVELLKAAGLGERLVREGMFQEKMEFRFDGRRRYVSWFDEVGKRTVVYGQHELVKDLIHARTRDNGRVLFNARAVQLYDLTSGRPSVEYVMGGISRTVHADYVVGTDGFHGISRQHILTEARRTYERVYPFQWLGILAAAPPGANWLVTGAHERGYAMHSMRSREVSRNYIQVGRDDTLERWTDDMIWDELWTRLEDPNHELLARGPIIDRTLFPLRNFVCEPMQFGRLFLAGDSAHIVPPTGGRGLNQAIADVAVLADALYDACTQGSTKLLAAYSETCLDRVWSAQRFTAQQTELLQVQEPGNSFARRIQVERLREAMDEPHLRAALAANYAGSMFSTSFLQPA